MSVQLFSFSANVAQRARHCLASAACRAGQLRPVRWSLSPPASSSNKQPQNCAFADRALTHRSVATSRVALVRLEIRKLVAMGLGSSSYRPRPPLRMSLEEDPEHGTELQVLGFGPVVTQRLELHASGRATDLRKHGCVQTKAKYRDKYHQPEDIA